jgi:5-methylcytosine-specific restriction endonuclease McrA
MLSKQDVNFLALHHHKHREPHDIRMTARALYREGWLIKDIRKFLKTSWRLLGFASKGDKRVREDRKEHKTSINKRLRDSDDYRQWRNNVFRRDNWTCKDCEQRGGDLAAHHIEGFAQSPQKRLDVDNGVTLCKSCHRVKHRKIA